MSAEKQVEFRSCAHMLELRADDNDPSLVGYAAVFDDTVEIRDGYFERIVGGAFERSLKDADIRALWNHDTNIVLGRTKNGTLNLHEDDHGLAVEIFPGIHAASFVDMVRRGDVNQMSFGFTVKKHDIEMGEDGSLTRTLLDVDLMEVSPVTFPAYANTEIAVRSMQEWEQKRWNEAQANDLAIDADIRYRRLWLMRQGG